jgi:uncharacterized protein (TIGR02145 family)
MKQITLLFTSILLAIVAMAQAPEAFNFQTIVRDGDGELLPNQAVTLKFLFHEDAPDGAMVYSELHQVVTNPSGLVNLQIGTGEVLSGDFSSLQWGNHQYFLEELIDIGNSGEFQVFGTVQLLSVPYALHANTAGNGVQSLTTQQRDALQNPPTGTVVYNLTTNCLNFWNGTNWFETCGECTPQPGQALAGDDQYFSDETTTTQLQGNQPTAGTGTWSVVSGSQGTFEDANNPGTLFTGLPCETYTLMWEITTACGSTGDMITIQFDAIPTTAAAGEDILINTEELTVQLSANAPITGSGLWTTLYGEGGTFADATNPQTTFTGLPCQSYTLRWTIATDCYESADEITVTFDAIPSQAVAGEDVIIFGDNTTVTLNAQAPEVGSGLWSIVSGAVGTLAEPANPATTFTATPCETYVLRWTVATDCYDNYDEISVSFDDTPATANAGSDVTICENNAAVLQGAAQNYQSLLWETSGTGTFSNPEIISPTYIPGDEDIADGTVTLTLTAWPESPCGDPASDQLILSIQQFAVADAGEDATLCATDSYTLQGVAENYASVLWATFGDGTFTASNTLAPDYTPGTQDIATGTATLLLTVQPLSPCNVLANDQVVLTIQQIPEAMAGNDATICADGEAALAGAASNYDAIEWTTDGDGVFTDPAALETTYTPGENDQQNGTVNLLLTALPVAPCTINAQSQLTLTIQPAPVANAGADAQVCANVPYTLNGQAQHFTSVLWTSSGTGNFDNAFILNPEYTPGPADISNGSVTLTLTAQPVAPCTIAASDEMILGFLAVPFVSAGPDQEELPGYSTTLQGNNPTGGATGLWTIASGQGSTIAQPANPQSTFTGTPGQTYLLQWSITAQNGCVNGDFVVISFDVPDGSPCPGMPTITDIDGNVYNTVKIGDQCWMAENLNIGTRIDGVNDQTNNGTIEKYCYNNAESNCDTYGGLYQWNEMMGYTTTAGVQGICPEGWHVPSDAEWTALTTYISSQPEYLCSSNTSYIAKALAATINWNSSSNTCAVGNNPSVNNSTDFTGLPGGSRYADEGFYDIGTYGYFWSSTETSPANAWTRGLLYGSANLNRSNGTKGFGFGVRCLRD